MTKTLIATKKKGAPKGNANAMRHGLRAGQLPRHCKYIEWRCNEFRRGLEQAVLDLRGSINITDAARINSATRWEVHAGLAFHWLTKEMDKLTPEQRLSFSRDVANASSNRDKCIEALKLNVDVVKNAWDTLQ